MSVFNYDADLLPDADNAAVGKYGSIAAGILPAAFIFIRIANTIFEVLKWKAIKKIKSTK